MRYLLAVVMAVSCVGCMNPYMNPAGSKAVSEIEQAAEMKKQTALLERQTVALEKIASECAR